MSKLRQSTDLSDLDLGVFIAREEIKKYIASYKDQVARFRESITLSYPHHFYYIEGLERAVVKLNGLLNVATLGEIE